MTKIIHSMIRVLEEGRSVEFYKKALALDIVERLDFGSFTIVYLSNSESEMELELTINHNQNAAYELGNGYGHLAVAVDDLDAEHARFEDLGLKPRKLFDFNHDGKLLARFFFVADPDGYEIEVMQRYGRYR